MIVRCEGLTKRFAQRRTWRETLRAPFGAPRVTAVDAVSFEVAPGEIFGLLGQNGAGKTTLFRMLATLLVPDGGHATVDGHDVSGDPTPVRRTVAPVLANERSLYWRLSALENLRLYAVIQGVPTRDVARECARVLAAVRLEDTGAKMVGGFSSGMRQRLLIARALLGRPRVLLLDEPTRSLDPVAAREFRRFLRESVVDAEGCTVLLATHDADDVWELCDRVGVLERGRLLAVDRASTLQGRVGAVTYELWVRESAVSSALTTLGALGIVATAATRTAEAGWRIVDAAAGIADAEGAARALAALQGAGIAVARCAPRTPALADVIERIVRGAA